MDQPGICAERTAALIRQSTALKRWREWLKTEVGELRYRLTVVGRARRETVRALLEASRAACEPFGLHDSPSRYAIELVVESTDARSRLFIRPSGLPDDRFRYRQNDVPAAINPVVGACLARLVRTSADATVVDPTCGSATLLVERALLDDATQLVGLDRSRAAIAAATANVQAAGLSSRIRIVEADALRSDAWPECQEVLANLPFGMRTGSDAQALDTLYRGILAQTARRLARGGRAVLYTAQRRTFEASLHDHRDRLQVEERLRTYTGGLWVHIWVLRR